MANKFKNTFMAQTTSKMYLNDQFADFTFTFRGEKVPVHKNILATASPVFAAMFYGPVKDNDTVEITDSYAEAFKELLQFFYLDKVTLSIENITEVAKLADKYNMLHCVNAFVENDLIDKNVLLAYKLAVILENENLQKICAKFISLNIEDILKSKELLRCDRNFLKIILEMDELVCNETEILDACLAWAKNACRQVGINESQAENLRSQLGDCLYAIRFASMTAEELTTHTVNYKRLLTDHEVAEILHTILVPSYNSSKFSVKKRSTRKWDSNKDTIWCQRDIVTKKRFISQEESLRFSVNTPVLLGMIFADLTVAIADFFQIRYNNSSKFEIEILEVCKKGEDESAQSKVLIKQCGDMEIFLDPPVIINPRKQYEIRTKKTTANVCYSNDCKWKSEYTLDDETRITFYDSEKQNECFVSELHFQRI